MVKRYYKCEETHQTVKGIKLKRCTKCKRWKELSEFNKDRARKDGLKVYCKSCNKAYVIKRRRKSKKPVRDYLRYEDRHRVIRGFKEKLCSRCKQWKYYSEFYKSSRTKDGLSFRCKECSNKATSKPYNPKKKNVRRYMRYEDRHRIIDGVKQKYCRHCKRWKNEDKFYKDRGKKDGLNDRCKKCSYKPVKKCLVISPCCSHTIITA
jgi:hypothetical protein